MYGELCRVLGRKLGAGRAMVVGLGAKDALGALLLPDDAKLVSPLTTAPVACVDVRKLGREAREAGRLLAVDNTLPSWAGCAAVRLGAHLSVEPLAEDATLIGIAKDVGFEVSGLPVVDDDVAARLYATLSGRELAWRAASDAAQVVATYLVCHPRVGEVRYPGLKQDPSFEIAARTLTGGFGPFVDYRLQGEASWHRLSMASDADPRNEILRLERLL